MLSILGARCAAASNGHTAEPTTSSPADAGLPVRAKPVLLAVVAAATALSAAAFVALDRGSAPWLGFVGLALASVLAQLFVVQFREDRKRREQVRAAEKKNRLLVEQLPLVTYVLTPDHTVGYVSPQIEAVLGCTVEDAIEK